MSANCLAGIEMKNVAFVSSGMRINDKNNYETTGFY